MLALRAHVSAVDALADAARCLPTPWLRASLDSAVRIGAIGCRGLRLLRHDPVVRPLLAGIDTSAGSGLETIARELARWLGFAVRTQVAIGGGMPWSRRRDAPRCASATRRSSTTPRS